MSFKPTSVPTKRLGQSISASSTSFSLDDIIGWDGVALTAADFGTQGYCVFRNGARTQIEIMEFDPSTIASTTITIVRRGLDFTGDPTTELSENKFAWTSGDTYVDLGTDTPQLWQWLKDYIDGIAVAGSPDASETAKGLVEEATDAQTAAGEATGETGAKLFVTPAKLLTRLSSIYTDVQTFTTAGATTWTKPSGAKSVYVQVWGAGGSGARFNNTVTNGEGGGGGGGGYSANLFDAASLSATENITIGAGGPRVTANGNGTAGGNSSFGTKITAYGGGGGAYSTTGGGGGGGGGALGAGGNASGATHGTAGDSMSGAGSATVLKVMLGAGGGGEADAASSVAGSNSLYGGGGGGGATVVNANSGGTSVYGGNGGAGASTGAGGANGGDGVQPGGGGGCRYVNGTGTTSDYSGAGGDGKIIVTTFF